MEQIRVKCDCYGVDTPKLRTRHAGAVALNEPRRLNYISRVVYSYVMINDGN